MAETQANVRRRILQAKAAQQQKETQFYLNNSAFLKRVQKRAASGSQVPEEDSKEMTVGLRRLPRQDVPDAEDPRGLAPSSDDVLYKVCGIILMRSWSKPSIAFFM